MQQGPDVGNTPPGAPGPTAKKGSNVGLIIGIVVAVLFGGVIVVGILAALAIHGFRNYLTAAKTAEGHEAVAAIARDVVQCAEREPSGDPDEADNAGGGLPPTTAPVPATLASIQGSKYMSSPGEWTTPGWDCIKFSMMSPQYFQYQWVRTSATTGVARAVADLDGDGAPEVTFESQVTCTTSPTLSCTAAPVEKKP
jgi:hypothetical protein